MKYENIQAKLHWGQQSITIAAPRIDPADLTDEELWDTCLTYMQTRSGFPRLKSMANDRDISRKELRIRVAGNGWSICWNKPGFNANSHKMIEHLRNNEMAEATECFRKYC